MTHDFSLRYAFLLLTSTEKETSVGEVSMITLRFKYCYRIISPLLFTKIQEHLPADYFLGGGNLQVAYSTAIERDRKEYYLWGTNQDWVY